MRKNNRFLSLLPNACSETAKKRRLNDTEVMEETPLLAESEQILDRSHGSQHEEDFVMEQDIEAFQRIQLHSLDCNTPLVYKSFNFMAVVKEILEYMKDPSNVLQCDDHVPLFEGSNVSKGQWARGLTSLVSKFTLSKKAENEIVNLLYNTWGHSANLPVSLTSNGRKQLSHQICANNKLNDDGGDADENNDDDDDDDDDVSISDENAISKIKVYNRKVSRWFAFHQCRKDCCVYIGKYYHSFVCPTCSSPRFRPCVNTNCKGKGNHDCEHLLNANDGVAYKSLHYRLLIPLITDLINTKYFVAALHYENECLHGSEEEWYSDILDGEVAKEHLKSMDSNYKAWCNENKSSFVVMPINLLLSDFYDGGQLFKRRACNFWGLFTSILNLPPTYRGKVGISTFLSAIYGGTHSTAEKFLFTDLYCEELRALYEGYEYISLSGQRFFIQARLMLHCMDTKAQEPVLGMQSMSNSKYGCPYCRNCHGQHNSHKTFFSGNRNTLPMDNYLRYFGQSGRCCPEGFYGYGPESKQWFHDEKFLSSNVPVTAESLLDKIKKSKFSTKASLQEQMDFCEPCDHNKERAQWIKDFLTGDAPYSWSHRDSGFDFKDISRDGKGIRDFIFYRHFDFRPEVKYRRITKEEHLKSAIEARELNKKRIINDKSVHGFKDVWPFDRLPYSDFSRNCSPPADHAIEGVVGRCFNYMFGFYKEKPVSKRKYKKKSDTADVPQEEPFLPIYRPSYHDGKVPYERPPYSCTTEQYDNCRALLKCVRIPTTINDRSDWVLDLDLNGQLKINQWKIFLSVYWNFCVSFLWSVNEWYSQLFHQGFF